MSVQAPTAPATTHYSFPADRCLPPENARAQAHSTLRPRHCCTYSVTPCTLPRIRPSSTPGPPSHPHQPGARLPSARPCNASRLSTPETRCASSTASAHMQNETETPAPISSVDCTSLIGHLRRYLTVRASLERGRCAIPLAALSGNHCLHCLHGLPAATATGTLHHAPSMN